MVISGNIFMDGKKYAFMHHISRCEEATNNIFRRKSFGVIFLMITIFILTNKNISKNCA